MRYVPAVRRRSIGRLAALVAVATTGAVDAGSAAAKGTVPPGTFATSPPPRIVVHSPTPKETVFLHRDELRADFHCKGSSAIFACTARAYFGPIDLGPVERCAFVPTRWVGPNRLVVRAIDVRGRGATRSVEYRVLPLDKAAPPMPVPPCHDSDPPTIRIGAPQAGTYVPGAELEADFDCQDVPALGPGMDASACTATLRPPARPGRPRITVPVTDGQRLNTATRGTYVFEVRAVDRSGNAARRKFEYRVGSPRAGSGDDGVSFSDDRSRT